MTVDQAPAGRNQTCRLDPRHLDQGVGGLSCHHGRVRTRCPGDVPEMLDGVHLCYLAYFDEGVRYLGWNTIR